MRKRSITPARLRQLWQAYTQFQASQLAYSTIHRDYRKVDRLLGVLPDYLTTAVEIRDWLLQRYAAETTRRYLMQLSACCKWAIASDIIDKNPFEGLPQQFRRRVNDTAWVGFTAEERDCIIQRFTEAQPFYCPWVKFLFWTGCRPEEAAALQWRHITHDCSQIHFREATPIDTKRRQATKTWKSRQFPANDRLKRFLVSLRPLSPAPADLLFTGASGKMFEYHNFQTRQWRPVINELVAEGRVSLYLPQSHCRHTFITLALDHLPVKDIAYLVGNSPDVIYRHYASRSRNLVIPEF